jgi:hypothetical protein
MSHQIWDKFLTERDKAVFGGRFWSTSRIRQATGAACD